MLARAEIKTEPLPFPFLVRQSKRRPNSLLEGGNIRYLAAHEHAFFGRLITWDSDLPSVLLATYQFSREFEMV